MNLDAPPTPRHHPTRRPAASTGDWTRKRTRDRGRTRLTASLIASALLILTIAALDQTNTPDENGDNRHNGFCVTQSHKFALIWTAAMPSQYKLKPR